MGFVRVKWLPIILAITLIFLQWRLWVQPGGLLEMFHLKKQLTNELVENDTLKKRNQVLLGEVQRIQNNNDTIESRARRELGMIKKGETFYQVVK